MIYNPLQLFFFFPDFHMTLSFQLEKVELTVVFQLLPPE